MIATTPGEVQSTKMDAAAFVETRPTLVASLRSVTTKLLERQQPPLPSRRVAATSYFPHIVHQTWRTHELPQGLRRLSKTWQKHLPRWKYRLHTDQDNLELVQKHYSWLLSAYRRFSAIQRADTARYLYMHAFGGVYADLDVELLQPLRSLLRAQRHLNVSVILGQEPLAHALLLERRPRQVCNAVLASVRGHPFWFDVLKRVASGAAHADPVSSTGPRMLEQALSAWNATSGHQHRYGGIVVVAPDVFFPTWDPMQADTFRQRCGTRGQDGGSTVGSGDLKHAIEGMCAKLRADGFQPTVPKDGSAYTNHLWSHTWIPGAEKRSVID